MDLSFDAFAVVFLLAPFVAAALAPVISRETGPAAGWILAIVPAGIFAALLQSLGAVAAGQAQHIALDWVPSLGLSFSLTIDGLSLTFALAITGIGAAIMVYSGAYLAGHRRRGYFLAIMLLFMGAMLGLVLSDSLVALFAFWELTSITSFLLIGFGSGRMEARRAALQALLVTALGGLALLAAGVLLALVGGSWNLHELLARDGPLDSAAYPWILALVLIAAFTKSAQLPFHFWLPNAMEAPTPVSAYLHSATMVQAGIYLLARMSPLLGGTPLWMGSLTIVGGATLLWGGAVALRQTDLKQILAQTPIAALGLMVMLLGVGGPIAAIAVAGFFVAHALYKAALFLVAGIIEHGTGTRDITALGGLRDHMTISFIVTALAALSMLGIPPFLGWFAKESAFAAFGRESWIAVAGLATLLLGAALMAAIALTLMVRPFFGPHKPTPQTPREGPFALWLGPAVLGLLGFSVVFALSGVGDAILAPMASATTGETVAAHLSLGIDPAEPAFWLSIGVWLLGMLIFLRLDSIRASLAKRSLKWTWDRGFDQLYFGLVRFAGFITRLLHHGRLELYLGVLFVTLALVLFVPLWTLGGWPRSWVWPQFTLYEWGVVALAAIGTVLLIVARLRIFAVLALGVQGLAVALLFILFGAPDLGFTQLLVETMSVVVIALVMTRLHLDANDPRPYEDLLRDGTLAFVCAVGISVLLLKVVDEPFNDRIGDFYAANAYAVAHGRNIVNVILVDFRGLDTLGEIAVLMTAGIAVLTLVRRQHKMEAPKPKRPPRKKASAI